MTLQKPHKQLDKKEDYIFCDTQQIWRPRGVCLKCKEFKCTLNHSEKGIAWAQKQKALAAKKAARAARRASRPKKNRNTMSAS